MRFIVTVAIAAALSACATPQGRFLCGLGIFAIATASISAGGGAPPSNIYSVCDERPAAAERE